MFGEIFLFELKSQLKKPATYIYFSILYMLALLVGLATAGFFDTSRSDSNMIVNSPFMIAEILLGTSSNLFSILISTLLISIMAGSIQKDYQYNCHPLFFTKPISKSGYFFGRFLSTALIAVIVFSSLPLGYFTGNLSGVGQPIIGPFKIWNYLQSFLILMVPNILLMGVIFFSLTTFLRTTMAAYIFAIILMVIQIASSSITAEIDYKMLAALLEPSGSRALNLVTEYWSPYERNVYDIPIAGALLYNRVLWLGLAVLICLLSYYGFQFSQFIQPLQWFKRKFEISVSSGDSSQSLAELPAVTQDYSAKATRKQLWWMSVFEAKKAVTSSFFIIICLLSIGLMLLLLNFIDIRYGSSTYLVTYKVVEDMIGPIFSFVLIFIIFYSGTIVWRERETKMDELVAVTPVSNTSLFLSKWMGLMLAILLLIAIASVAGILMQLYFGYFQIDLLQYLVDMLRSLAVGAILIAYCLSMQVYASNKYLGFFLILIPIIILPIVYGLLEWNYELIDFNSTGASLPYSDMNGYGGTFTNWPFYRIYWLSIIFIFVFFALVLYARGKEKSLKARWKLSSYLLHKCSLLLLSAAILAAAATGTFIHYQTRILKQSDSQKEVERATAEMEKKYGRYRFLKQPRIIAVKAEVDIYPNNKNLRMAASYLLKNKTDQPIDTLLINYFGGKKSPYQYRFLQPKAAFTILKDDTLYGIRLIRLQKPLLPGDSIAFEFDMKYSPKGLLDKINSPVVENGTFINNSLMPSLGYDESSELNENAARIEYGLPPKSRMARVDDPIARMNNYISQDADWIQFEATVSTEAGQIAIAPGYLQKEWEKDGRRYFQYKMDSLILNFYSVLSADYQVKRDQWKGVNIEIYYHKGHEYNLDRMIRSIKRSLDYYTVNFGPYQHRQVRIIEFPRYQSFAQSFPNTIPYSESIGFITKVEEGADKIDIPFFVTAHEVAHQWWAHQVIGGNVQGSVLMSESMSEYCALMVMEKEYGKTAMRKFLKEEMNDYLSGRTMEGKGEMPLMLVENQQYIHYNKGSVILYALSEFIGEKKLNGAIRAYLEKNRFSDPPYTNSLEFVDYIRRVVPDSLSYLIPDMFEKITLYENYVKSLSYRVLPDKRYEVTLTVGSAKFYADSIGKLNRTRVNDYMDIAVYKKKGKSMEKEVPQVVQRIKMDQPEKTFRLVVSEKPESAGIDPYLILIDRNPENNQYRFNEKPEKPDWE